MLRSDVSSLLAFVAAAGLTAGCGSVKTSADGGDVDAPVGADDAGAGADAQVNATVTVRVLVDGEVAEDVAVMYHDVDGAYLGSILTDAEGEVVIEEMPVGGAVTAPVSPFSISGSQQFLSTVMDVEDGDVLTFGASTVEDFARAGSLDVTFPQDPVAAATSYRVFAGCGLRSTSQAGTEQTVTLRDRCVGSDDQVSAVAYAEDDEGERLAYSTAADVQLSGTRPDLTGTASLTTWNTDLAELNMNYQAPVGTSELITFFSTFRGEHQVEEVDEERQLSSLSGTETFKHASGAYDRTALGVFLPLDDGEASVASLMMDSTTDVASASSSKDVSYDFESDLFGTVENVAVAEGDPLGITFEASDLSCKGNDGADKAIWTIEALAEASAATGVATQEHIWIVLSPGDIESGVTLPELDPAAAQSLWPQSRFLSTEASLSFFADSDLSYEEMRNSEQSFRFLDLVPEGDDGTICILLHNIFAQG